MASLGATTILGVFSYAKYQTRVSEILARHEWNDGNRGVFGSIVPDRLWIVCLLFPVSLQRK
jgi:hypothetical protein